MQAPNFSQIETGFKLDAVTQKCTQETIDRYAIASLDMNPVHTNTDWAARAQVFGAPVTVQHGMATMSLMASVVTRAWGVVSLNGGSLRSLDSKFTKPVLVGETVTATGTVKRKHYDGAGKNWVTVSVEARDTKGDVVAVCDIGYRLPD